MTGCSRLGTDTFVLRPCCRALVLIALAGCSPADPFITVYAADDLLEGEKMALGDLVHDVERVTGAHVRRAGLPAPHCTPESTDIIFLGHAAHDALASVQAALPVQGYTIDEDRCGGGHRVVLRGGGLFSSQWAIYDLLERLGIRYLHAEQTLYPPRLTWPVAPIHVRATPAFQGRGLYPHTVHPIELSIPYEVGDLDIAGMHRRWVDWNVKMRGTTGGGWNGAFIGDYATVRGFPRETGLNLLESQQGGRPVLDPDDPRPEEEQLASAIDARMGNDPENYPVSFGFTFNPSEFTEANDVDTVRRMTFVSNYLTEHYPKTLQWTINHPTAGPPTPTYGVRFYDLSHFAPPALGVRVHTVMFFDFTRPAPVYGNEDFSHLLEFARNEAQVRRIDYFPESSYWLTFDIAVPLFLAPVTLEARQRDLSLLADLVVRDPAATHGVYSSLLFTSGQEWGYWLIDYCFSKMVFDLSYTHTRCLDDFFGALARPEVLRDVWRDVEARQITELHDPELLRFFVGGHQLPPTAAVAQGRSALG
jgi:hypothetical protein